MMHRLSILSVTVLLSSLAWTVHAASVAPSELPQTVSAYRKMIPVGTMNIAVPTVVALPLENTPLERNDFAIADLTAGTFEPYLYLENAQKSVVTVRADGADMNLSRLVDSDRNTFTDFPLPDNAQGSVRITLTAEKPFASTALTTLLDNYVALPKTIEIRTLTNGQEKIVLAMTAMNTTTVRFPKTKAQTWIVTLTFGQPLRIAELHLSQDDEEVQRSPVVRFLAQPSHEYRVYFDPDRRSSIPVGEAGNLSSNDNVRTLKAIPAEVNVSYVIADTDADGIPDLQDNCVQTPNADQKDIDGNNRGDACDDFDRDGLITIKDNCPSEPNSNQMDTDSDGIGDVCDAEESRITEKNAWLPWAGMGFAAVVLVGLGVSMLRQKKE